MKKFYMILAAIAALTITTQAQEQMWGTIEVGDFENLSTYNGSYFDMAPTNFYVAHTGAQMLYTPDLLADMDGKQNVRINQVDFMFHDESFDEICRDVVLFLQEVDATEFAVDENGVKQFFPLGEPIWAETRNIEMIYMYGEDFVLPFRLDFPFTPGKSLLLTMVFDAQDDDNCTMGSEDAPFYTSGIRGKAMTYTNNWTSFLDFAQGEDFPNATVMLGCGTNVDLPFTRIQYIYEVPFDETCLAPNTAYEITGTEQATVTITNREPGATVYYEVYCDGELVDMGEFFGESFNFDVTGDGNYVIHAIAKLYGKNDSPDGGVFFTIMENEEPPTAVNELVNSKQVADVHYFNMAGQEIPEVNGMTIVVTTYTDGTTSTDKVVK